MILETNWAVSYTFQAHITYLNTWMGLETEWKSTSNIIWLLRIISTKNFLFSLPSLCFFPVISWRCMSCLYVPVPALSILRICSMDNFISDFYPSSHKNSIQMHTMRRSVRAVDCHTVQMHVYMPSCLLILRAFECNL